MWRQCSRALQLTEGDKYTKYFHNKATNGKKKNFIACSKDNSGAWHLDKVVLVSIISPYFTNLFSTSSSLDMEEPFELCGDKVK